MKFIFTFLLWVISISGVAWYESQWFEKFTFEENIIDFSCSSTCFVNLGDYKDYDSLELAGGIVWDGIIGIWILLWDKVNTITSYQVSDQNTFSKTYHIFEQSFYGQIREGSQIILIISWSVSSDHFIISSKKAGFMTHMIHGIQFNEWLTPYSINLRYGAKIFWISFTQILYIVFCIIIGILLIIGKCKKDTILYTILIFFLILSAKNLYDYSRIYFWWLQSQYISESDKTFHHLGDYYDFTRQVRTKMWIDDSSNPQSIECSYYSECAQNWPFCYNWKTIFLKPCENTKNIEEADFILIHKKEIPESFQSKTILHSQNNSYLLKN